MDKLFTKEDEREFMRLYIINYLSSDDGTDFFGTKKRTAASAYYSADEAWNDVLGFSVALEEVLGNHG